MLNKKDVVWFLGLFLLEFFLLEGNGVYPFAEAFLPFLFLKAKDKHIIPISFFTGLLMDLSVNSLGVFSLSYTIFAIILKALMEYTMELDYFKFILFIAYDVLVKFTNILIIYLKYGHVDFGVVGFGVGIMIDFACFVVLNKFYR